MCDWWNHVLWWLCWSYSITFSCMKKMLFLISALIACLFWSTNTYALSNSLVWIETYPWKMDTRNVNWLGKNVTTDFFAWALSFHFPMSFPEGSRGMTPKLTLSYSSNNSDAFSPYGYGFSLSLKRITRNAKKWVSELYEGKEFVVWWNDLIPLDGNPHSFRSKDGEDGNLYILSGSTFIVMTKEWKKEYYGSTRFSRIAWTEDESKIYAWLLDREEDNFGHRIDYSYFLDGGQPYVDTISYGHNPLTGKALYQIRFSYEEKTASSLSYRTQFEISTKKVLSRVSLFVDDTYVREYAFSYDTLASPASHLISIEERVDNETLPPMTFSYGSGQYSHMIQVIDNHRGWRVISSYAPSTMYRWEDGELQNKNLPFVVNTLIRQVFEDTVTGINKEESYSYGSWHYYFDEKDIWGREYVGFWKVTIEDESLRTDMYFHQSENTDKVPEKFDDHIRKKWRVYKTELFDKKTKKILSRELTQFAMKDSPNLRKYIYPLLRISSVFDINGNHIDTATRSEIDDIWNVVKEENLWFVRLNTPGYEYTDIPGDTSVTLRTFTSNFSKNLFGFMTSEQLFGFNNELLSETRYEYDYTASWLTLWLMTSKIIVNVVSKEEAKEELQYSSGWLLTKSIDPLRNTTLLEYDIYDITPKKTINTLGWITSYIYDYSSWKRIWSEDYNGLKLSTEFDSFWRTKSNSRESVLWKETISELSYDDKNIPNNREECNYFEHDKKCTRTYADGWGRPIEMVSSSKNPGEFIMNHIHYDDAGNVIFGSYPVFMNTNSFDALPFSLPTSTGDDLKTRFPGVSAEYDALGRRIIQKDSRGTTKKVYTWYHEEVTNTFGNISRWEKDARWNLISFVETIDGKELVTSYKYDALGRMVWLSDAKRNVRTWKYNGIGKLEEATDLHAPEDTSYGIRRYLYDQIWRLREYENAKWEHVSYDYDHLSRITKEQIWTDKTRIFTYDYPGTSLGMLSSITDSGTTVSYSYDPFWRKIGETRKIGDKQYSFGYEYALPNILKSITYPNGWVTKYSYQKWYIESVWYTNSGGVESPIISHISYTPTSQIQSISYANGITKTMKRDENNNYRLTDALSILPDGTRLVDTHYEYDGLSNITSVRESGIEPLRKTVNYTYDELSRLQGASYLYGVSGYTRNLSDTMSFHYDDIWNITETSEDGRYRYAWIWKSNPHAVTQVGDMIYEYDDAGQLSLRDTGSGNTTFSYSPYGEMTASMRNNKTTEYIYDHSRRRVSKISPWLIEHHVIDGYEVEYEEIPVIYEPITLRSESSVVSTGSTFTDSWETSSWSFIEVSTGSEVITGTYVADTSSHFLATMLTHIMIGDEKIASIISQENDEQLVFHIADHIASSSVDVSSTWVILQASDYLPFWKTHTYEISQKREKWRKGWYENKYLFANKQQDDENDLQYFEKRYYDNRIWRFTTEDPVFWEVGLTKRPGQYMTSPQEWNSYSYVRNNPINLVDPTGEQLTATSEDLKSSDWLKKNDATSALMSYMNSVVDTIKAGWNSIYAFYEGIKNGSPWDIKRQKWDALWWEYAFDIWITNWKKEDEWRFWIIINKQIYALDEIWNFLVWYAAGKVGINKGVLKTFSAGYQVKTSIFRSLWNAMIDEKYKDSHTYDQWHDFSKDKWKNKTKALVRYISRIRKDF